ncbi:MAG: peptidoglycan bridge formation glycyltransferase FemA/FemB family protein [Chloroflexi bacterium]|jgi:lipid II:glycine glycyltransferase (peptidoglycan interpeptide bridge formation enzyme)|nr:peptidoglycan bridge formation glycyltransferase FemA/FemB family protein [Chloroflexota bacterium]
MTVGPLGVVLAPPLDAADPVADPWDVRVAADPHGSYLQTRAWARVKARNGWEARIVSAQAPAGPVGAQVLLRRPRPVPWTFGYAPRGPVATAWDAASMQDLAVALRADARASIGRLSHVRFDPEVEADGPDDADGRARAALVAAGFRPAPPIQPDRTRIVDLSAPEEALWSDLRKKWRQYVNRARAEGVAVRAAEADELDRFYAIYEETAARAGFLIRTLAAYRDVWDAFRPDGRATLLLAESRDGLPLAALFLVATGLRVVEPYGGMTAAGAEVRANYLLKWEAILRAKAAGATAYDMWGLAHPGIEHFKTGFGGREVRYIGAWDLVLDPVGRAVYERGQATRVRWARRRAGLEGDGPRSVGAD